MNLTKNWTSRVGGDVPNKIYDWILDPSSAFWGFKSFREDTEFVEYCLNDIDETEDIPKRNPIRRRVILVILHDIIQKEMRLLQTQAETRGKTRKYDQSKSSGKQSKEKPKYLTTAIKNVVDRTYRSHDLSDDAKAFKRKRCTQLQRYGGRWSLFTRRESILEFPIPNATDKLVNHLVIIQALTNLASSFERVRIKEIEVEALNAYEKTMYDDEYRSHLRQAFDAIYDAYLLQRSKFSFPCIQIGAAVPPTGDLYSQPGKKRARENNLATTRPCEKRSRNALASDRQESLPKPSIRPRGENTGRSSNPPTSEKKANIRLHVPRISKPTTDFNR